MRFFSRILARIVALNVHNEQNSCSSSKESSGLLNRQSRAERPKRQRKTPSRCNLVILHDLSD